MDSDVLQQVRAGDYDRFLAIQLAPASVRPALYAVTALNLELARIAEIVSEPLVGHIRLAWWCEALAEITDGKPARNHPLVLALADIYTTHADIFPLLQRMVEARGADLDTSLIAGEAGWLDYCDNTAGALHMAWALLLDADAALEHAATIAVQARRYAIIGLVRAIPYMTAQGWLRFPHARMNAHGITSLAPSAELPLFMQTLLGETSVPLAQSAKLPRSLKPLTALARLNQFHAQKIACAGYNPYRLRPTKLGAVWRVLLVNIM